MIKIGFMFFVAAQPLYLRTDGLTLDIGWKIGGGTHYWGLDSENIIIEIDTEIKDKALLFLDSIPSPESLIRAIDDHKKGHFEMQRVIAYSWILEGNIYQATQILERVIAMSKDGKYEWVHNIEKEASELLPMMTSGRINEAQTQFEKWSMETI